MNETEDLILKFALQNAVRFNGIAQAGNVVPKVIGANSELKKDMKTLMVKINEIVAKVNVMDKALQLKMLEEIAPELLEKKEKEERDIFAFLGINQGDKVVSAFPPGPEKYPHIGHAKACLLNYLLAKQYNGKFVLRFEDTNPELVKGEFYDIFKDNLSWLGVKWDSLVYASDNMELFYKFAENAIAIDKAYMCFCEKEAMQLSRSDAVACKCRSQTVSQNMKFWKEFKTYPEGKATLRLKIDLEHQNTTMRDPTIFRIINAPHARHGTKYRVWPNYDFQNAIMDGYYGITIRLRSKEFEMRSELQRYIQNMLGINESKTYEFARFNMIGVDNSGRVIREKIGKGEYIGWDDPRLTTIVALRRRGFTPEAITNFVVSTGITKSESTLTWDDLIVQNKKIVDKSARRFFFLYDCEKIKINGAPKQELTLENYPNMPQKGYRTIHTDNEFLISKDDSKDLVVGEMYRLMDCLNFRKTNDGFMFDSKEHAKYKGIGKKIMHFLPAEGNVNAEIFMNDATRISGLAESNIKELSVGDIVQFERFGFCRLDAVEHDVYKFWFTHK
ncbi:MAG: glutamate--tRNA ligase [archaeon]